MLQFEPRILTKTGEVSDMHKLHKTIISHIVGTLKCYNFLTVYQNDSDSDYYLTNGFHLAVHVYYNEHTDDVKMW